MSHEDLVDFLARTPSRLRQLCRDARPTAMRRPIDGGWTPLQVLGHLKDSITINEQRFERIVNEDEPMIQIWDQDESAARSDYNSTDPVESLDEIAAARGRTIALFRSLDDQQWQRAGLHEDPQWGRITIEWLAGHLREHEHEHISDLERALSQEG